MILKGISFRNLCMHLADSENALRKGQKVNTAYKGGRADQLAYMEEHFPSAYPNYITSLDDRLSKPRSFQTILESIPVE